MAKVQIKSEKLTPFGGIFSIMEQFDSMLSPIIAILKIGLMQDLSKLDLDKVRSLWF